MSYFPITIRYTDTGEIVQCKTPVEIKSGRTFIVINCQKKEN